MKCEVCNKEKAEYITAEIEDGTWYFECKDCESARSYWIGLDDFRKNFDEWVDHLSRKNWFNYRRFVDKLAELHEDMIASRKRDMEELWWKLEKTQGTG